MKRLLLALVMFAALFAITTAEMWFIAMPPSVRAQTNTFCASNLACTVTGAWTFSNATFSNINGIRYIDGTTYAKSAAGINAAIQATPSSGGTIVLPAGQTQINATIVIDRPIQLIGQNGNYNGRGTQLQWTGGASQLITIAGAAGISTGTTLQDINIDNTGTGTVGVDIDNNAVFVTLINVNGVSTVPFSIAGIRIGNSTAGAAVTDVYFDRVDIENNPINLLMLRCFHFVANRSRFVNGTTNEIQIGDATHVVDSAHFFGYDIEPSSTNNVTEVNVLNGSNITFDGGFAEQTGPTSIWLDCPATATNCNNIAVRGGWFQGNSSPVTVFHMNLASATLSVESSEANNFPAASFWVKNDNARRIWLNNLIGDVNISQLTSNTNASFGSGNTGSTTFGPYVNDPIIFRGDVTFSTNSSVASRWLFSRGTVPSVSGESCYDDSTKQAVLCSFNAGSYSQLMRYSDPTITLKKGSGAGNYTNATTSYTVADSTNLCLTVTIPTGWKLGVSASGALATATAAVVAQAALTDNAACATANAGILIETAPIQGAAIGVADAFALNWVITGDGAAHNIAMQFKTSNAADTASLINSSATVVPTIKFELLPSN